MANMPLNAFMNDSEAGTMTKLPRLTTLSEYSSWSSRFESFLSIVNPSLMIPIEEGYEQPMLNGLPKRVSRLTEDEKKAYDLEKKAYALLTMALPKEIHLSFKTHKQSKLLWDALAKRCEGSDQLKKKQAYLVEETV